nr:ATP-binding cassette domain-containing protein [Lysinibacillus timonensis]
MLQVKDLVGGYSNTPIINGINLEVKKSEFFALLGPNGSGKTTLFKLITGQLPIHSGHVFLSGTEVSAYSNLEKAKKIAVLTQEVQVSFDYTVEEIVSLGRYPHQKGILKNLAKEDRKIIEEVMEITKVTEFRKKQFRTISGGEKQRVLLAKALAQEPELLLLDEPTNHLDIKHTFQLLDVLKERQQTMGLTIFSILHDLNVAAFYADRFALLHNGNFLEVGDVNVLRKEEQLEKVYQVKVNAQSHPIVPKPQLLMTPKYTPSTTRYRFDKAYKIKQTDQMIHIQFSQPLRTISNGMIGDGIQWLKDFCHLNISGTNHITQQKELRSLEGQFGIPFEQASVTLSNEKPSEIVMVTEEIDGIQMKMVMILMMKDVVDKSAIYSSKTTVSNIINIMLFINAHLTDGALVNGYMLATEAKMKALQDLRLINLDAKTDTLILATTQEGKEIDPVQSKTVVGKAISEFVYNVTIEAVKKYL